MSDVATRLDPDEEPETAVARMTYAIADAMLKERDKK